MRGACLQAQADRASPLVLKSIVRAVSTAWREFSDIVSTPYGMLTVLLFLISSLVMPVVPWLRMLRRAVMHPDDSGDEYDDMEQDQHVIVLAGANGHSLSGGIKRRLTRVIDGSSGFYSNNHSPRCRVNLSDADS